jgi:hypothetical protein
MQPVGRVLDELPQSRFWMRVSPITCLVDMVLFFTWVLVDYFDPFQPPNIIEGSRWARFCYHFRAEVAYRFRDGDRFFPSGGRQPQDKGINTADSSSSTKTSPSQKAPPLTNKGDRFAKEAKGRSEEEPLLSTRTSIEQAQSPSRETRPRATAQAYPSNPSIFDELCGFLLWDRSASLSDEESEQAPSLHQHSFETRPLGRWALLGLSGTYCQSIKLLALRGAPVTRAIAAIYLSTLIFGEAIRFTAESISQEVVGAEHSVQPQHPLSTRNPTRTRLTRFATVLCSSFYLAAAEQTAFLRTTLSSPSPNVAEYLAFSPLLIILIGCSLMIEAMANFTMVFVDMEPGYTPEPYWLLGVSFVAAFAAILAYYKGALYFVFTMMLFLPWLLFNSLCTMLPFETRHFLGFPTTYNEQLWALRWFRFLSLAFGYYIWVFDGRDILLPEWVGHFG